MLEWIQCRSSQDISTVVRTSVNNSYLSSPLVSSSETQSIIPCQPTNQPTDQVKAVGAWSSISLTEMSIPLCWTSCSGVMVYFVGGNLSVWYLLWINWLWHSNSVRGAILLSKLNLEREWKRVSCLFLASFLRRSLVCHRSLVTSYREHSFYR